MTKWKSIIITTITFLLLISIVSACTVTYNRNRDVILLDVIEPTGDGLVCNITVFNQDTTLNQTGTMTNTGTLAYNYSAGQLVDGLYSASIECGNATSLYQGECKFKVQRDKEKMIATIIGFIAVIAFFGIMGFVNKRGLGMKLLSFGLALVELFFMVGVLYIDEAGGSLTTLLQINFWIMLFVGFWVGAVAIYDMSTNLLTFQKEGEEPKDQKKWGKPGW